MKNILLFLMFLVLPAMAADFSLPSEPNRPVNDYSGVLTAEGKEKIATELVNLKKTVGAQLAVVIVDTIGDNSLEEVTMNIAHKWHLGSKDSDDGLLLFLAVKDHKMRIEVGTGLEGVITDVGSHRILDSMKGSLRAKNYDGAILAGIQSVSSTIQNHKEDIMTKPRAASSGAGNFGMYLFFGFLGILGLVLTAMYLAAKSEEAERQEREHREQRDAMALARAQAMANNGRRKGEDYVVPAVVAAEVVRETSHKRRDDDDDSSRRSSYRSSDDSSSSSSSNSDSGWSGGGGDFSGGGSSDSW